MHTLYVSMILSALLLSACAAQNRPLQLISGQGPIYPAAARASGMEGSVTVRYDVAPDGSVQNARVVASEPPGIFDAAALAAVRSWRFNAPLVNGERQAAPDRQSELAFRLGGSSDYDNF